MYLIMKRILLLTILTYLKIAVILANSAHSTFLCICKVIADIFQLTVPHLLSESSSTRDSSTRNISRCSSPKVSTSAQTEEELKQLENASCKSSTDVIIYNLNSTQKLVISQGKFKKNECENCKPTAEIATSEKVENVTAPTVGFDGSNISYMSIESDVIDSKIENGYISSPNSSGENTSLSEIIDRFNSQLVYIEDSNIKSLNSENDNYEKVSFGSDDNTCLNPCNDKFNVSLDFENLKENDPDNTYVKCDGTSDNKQKTSSPINNLFQSPQNLCNNLSMFNADQSRITGNKDAGLSTDSDYWGNDAFNTDIKRRFSLPVKLNTTNTAVINFKLAQKKLIEDALKSTSRHEKSLKEIKYPFSSELSLDSKPEELDDKIVFSCSSYESLPVSDHLRNAFNNSTLLGLYNENLHSKDKLDFSCIDNLVETFNEIKSNLSVPNLSQSKIIPFTMSKNDVAKEKGLESLNGVLTKSSLDDRMLKDYPELSDDLKNTKLVNDKKVKRTLCPAINLSTSISDMCNVLDRFVTSETKLVSGKISKCFDKGGLRTDNVLNPGVNYTNNEQSGINDGKKGYSSTKEYKSFRNSILKPENKENNTGENKMNQIKCATLNPLKSVPSDVCEWPDNFENTGLSLKDKSETNKSDNHDNSLPKVFQQSYHKIVFIDESPSLETIRTNQNASETNCKDQSLNENEKPTLFEVNTLKDSGVETNKSVKYDNFHQRCYKSFGETEADKNNKNLMTCMSSLSPSKENAGLLESTGDCENTVHSLKNKVGINKTANYDSFCWQQYKAPIDKISICKTKQNILEANCQEHQSTIFEEYTSSGDSASDNSGVTVKDLSVAGD